MKIERRWKIFAVLAVISLAADIATKVWANSSLTHGVSVEFIDNFWAWRLSYNTGSAFGLFSSAAWGRVFLTVVGIGALGFVFYMQHKAKNDQTWMTVALGLVAGGAIGNLADRIIFGQVTDFVVWKYYETEWPTFNIADVALCIGVGMLLIDSFKQGREEKRQKLAEAEAETAAASKTPKKKPGNKKRK